MEALTLDDRLVVTSKLLHVPQNPLLIDPLKPNALAFRQFRARQIERLLDEVEQKLEDWRRTARAGSRFLQDFAAESKEWIDQGQPGQKPLDPDLTFNQDLENAEKTLTKRRSEITASMDRFDQWNISSARKQVLIELLHDVDDHIVDWINASQEIRWNIRLTDGMKLVPSGKAFANADDFMSDLQLDD